MLDATDRRIVDALQGGFPVCERPFLAAAAGLGVTEDELIARIDALLADGTLTRFGPLFDAEKLGGAFTLAAMQVPSADYERVAAAVNALPEVAHNYAREHDLNMWFVLGTETPAGIAAAIARIEAETGLPVNSFPKEREFFVELKLPACT
jgi:DNA-binding Lrp family transcriptional regulator